MSTYLAFHKFLLSLALFFFSFVWKVFLACLYDNDFLCTYNFKWFKSISAMLLTNTLIILNSHLKSKSSSYFLAPSSPSLTPKLSYLSGKHLFIEGKNLSAFWKMNLGHLSFEFLNKYDLLKFAEVSNKVHTHAFLNLFQFLSFIGNIIRQPVSALWKRVSFCD